MIKPKIDYRSLLLICDCLDEIQKQGKYIDGQINKTKKDLQEDTVTISLDTFAELQEFLQEDIPNLTELVRNMAKRMENKLREYKEKAI